jgi:hypothetical protein
VFLKIVCAWCGKFMGIKKVENATLPVSHSICCKCKEKLLAEADEALQRYHKTQQTIKRR